MHKKFIISAIVSASVDTWLVFMSFKYFCTKLASKRQYSDMVQMSFGQWGTGAKSLDGWWLLWVDLTYFLCTRTSMLVSTSYRDVLYLLFNVCGLSTQKYIYKDVIRIIWLWTQHSLVHKILLSSFWTWVKPQHSAFS